MARLSPRWYFVPQNARQMHLPPLQILTTYCILTPTSKYWINIFNFCHLLSRSGQSCPSSRWITSAFWTTHKMQPQRLTQPMRPRQLSTRSRLSRATRCTLLVAGCKLPPRFAELRVARDCRVSRMTRISRKSSPSRARRCTLLYATRYLHVTSSLPARCLLHVTCTLPARYLQGEQEKKGKSSSKKGKSGTKRTRQVASDSSEEDEDNRPLSQVVNQNDDDQDPQAPVKITSRAEAE